MRLTQFCLKLVFHKISWTNAQRQFHPCQKAVKDTLRKLQSVTGLLNFAFAVQVQGIKSLTDLTVGVRKPHYHIRITGDVKQDLHACLNFLSTTMGKACFSLRCSSIQTRCTLNTAVVERRMS